MADACHHDADIGEGSAIGGLFHVAMNTYMDLEDSGIVSQHYLETRALEAPVLALTWAFVNIIVQGHIRNTKG